MRRILLVLFVLFGVIAAPVAPRVADAAPVDRIASYGSAPDRGSPDLAPGQRPVGIAAAAAGGYWVATSDGGVYSFGAPFHGAATGQLSSPAVAIVSNPARTGYWIATVEGGVHAFGAAPFHGSLGGTRPGTPIVGMASAPDGNGYWLVGANGAVWAYGSARHAGDLAATRLAAPIVGIAATPGGGYWLVGADGGIFTFGGAPFHGSAGALRLVAPIVAMAATPTGGGYYLVAADGGVFTYGDARFRGAPTGGSEPIVGMATRGTEGYWLVRSPRNAFPALPQGSGTGRRIVYSNPMQRVWLVESNGEVVRSYLVSGRYKTPAPGTYSVYSKSRKAFAGHDGITMDDMVRFTRAASGTPIGFHGIPRYADGSPMQSDNELGEFRSAGCVRQSGGDAAFLYDWAPIGTTVVVLH